MATYEKYCPNCGKLFKSPTFVSVHNFYCSSQCRKELIEKKEIAQKGKCFLCKDIKNVEQHHVIPIIEYNKDNFTIPLCKKCHEIITRYITRIRKKGYSTYKIM